MMLSDHLIDDNVEVLNREEASFIVGSLAKIFKKYFDPVSVDDFCEDLYTKLTKRFRWIDDPSGQEMRISYNIPISDAYERFPIYVCGQTIAYEFYVYTTGKPSTEVCMMVYELERFAEEDFGKYYQ
jgi:hypothetical protein